MRQEGQVWREEGGGYAKSTQPLKRTNYNLWRLQTSKLELELGSWVLTNRASSRDYCCCWVLVLRLRSTFFRNLLHTPDFFLSFPAFVSSFGFLCFLSSSFGFLCILSSSFGFLCFLFSSFPSCKFFFFFVSSLFIILYKVSLFLFLLLLILLSFFSSSFLSLIFHALHSFFSAFVSCNPFFRSFLWFSQPLLNFLSSIILWSSFFLHFLLVVACLHLTSFLCNHCLPLYSIFSFYGE